uniref:Uncharacterized protein n=1 Tax=Anguilla anguilla TaxID=7936 RepID=A0A0E9TXE8_ANGAN
MDKLINWKGEFMARLWSKINLLKSVLSYWQSTTRTCCQVPSTCTWIAVPQECPSPQVSASIMSCQRFQHNF